MNSSQGAGLVTIFAVCVVAVWCFGAADVFGLLGGAAMFAGVYVGALAVAAMCGVK